MEQVATFGAKKVFLTSRLEVESTNMTVKISPTTFSKERLTQTSTENDIFVMASEQVWKGCLESGDSLAVGQFNRE